MAQRRYRPDKLLARVIAAGQELDAAGPRGRKGRAVGGLGRLGWLLDFTRQTSWLPEDEPGQSVRLLACGLPRLPANVVRLRRRLTPLSSSEIRALHAKLESWFRTLVRTPGGAPGVRVPTEGLEQVLVRMTRPNSLKLSQRGIFGLSSGGPLETMIFQHAAQWITETDRLVACPRCRQPFLALRKKLFCTDQCTRAHHDELKMAARKAARTAAQRRRGQ